MLFLWIALAVIALWVTFIYAPSFVMYRMIFSRRPVSPPTADSLAATPLAPHAKRIVGDMEFLASLNPERVTVTAADGVSLAGDYFRRGEGRTAIFFHGYNTHPMKNFAVHARMFYERGYDVLVVFERAHGESGGKRGGMGLLERNDVPLWIAKARELSPGCRVVLYGTSMGASTVAYASAALDPGDVDAIVIDCGFTSPYSQLRRDAVMRKLPAFMLMPLITLHARLFGHLDLRESTADALAKCAVPAFFLHGDGDLTVPCESGLCNYEACASRKELAVVAGSAHTAALLDDADAAAKLFNFIEDRPGVSDAAGERE